MGAILGVVVISAAMPATTLGYTKGFSKELVENLEAERHVIEEEAAKRTAKEESEKRQREEAETKAVQEHAAQEHRVQEEVAQETSEREAAEKQSKAQMKSTMCVVPNLKGNSLGKARIVLKRHHCRLGKVSRAQQRGNLHGTEVIVGQQYRSSEHLPENARIGVTVGLFSASKYK